MATAVHPEAWIDPGIGRAYLRDQGLAPDDDLLIEQINLITALMLDATGRKSWKVTAPTLPDTTPPASNLVALLDASDSPHLYLRHWPLQFVHQIEEDILSSNPSTIAGPTDWGDTETDDFLWEEMGGLHRKNGYHWAWAGKRSLRITATIGYLIGSDEALALRALSLDFLAWHYNRWMRKADGLESQATGLDESISFSASEIPKSLKRQLSHYALGGGVA